MEFWQTHMPRGMYLRSACDWHLDPDNVATIDRFLALQGRTPSDVEPLSLQFYLTYASGFRSNSGSWRCPFTSSGSTTSMAPPSLPCDVGGWARAAYTPRRARSRLQVLQAPSSRSPKDPAPGRFSHTCDLVTFDALAGKRCLIVGGRQSAFEWAALLREAGAAEVHLSYRHPSPAFAASDWSWVAPIVDGIAHHPAGFGNCPSMSKEPWCSACGPRGVSRSSRGSRHACSTLAYHFGRARSSRLRSTPGGEIVVHLDSGERLVIDHILLPPATR